MRVKRDFFVKDTLEVAKALLGKIILRKYKDKIIAGKVVETEAYIGPKDKASHAYLGKKTKRNQAEFFIGGYIYIYLVYGMYWQLNISTGKEGKPECVLIRALQPLLDFYSQDIKEMIKIANGPGKLCNYLKLDKSFYGEDLTKSKRIWIEDWSARTKNDKIIYSRIPEKEIVKTSRIGIEYAGPYWSKIKWRFYIKNNPFVSRK